MQQHVTQINDTAFCAGCAAFEKTGNWDDMGRVRATVRALGNARLAHDTDVEDYQQARLDNEDNEFWQMLDEAGACMAGLTIVSGIDNWHDLLALLQRLRRWDWCGWVCENHTELGLEPEDEIFKEFANLA